MSHKTQAAGHDRLSGTPQYDVSYFAARHGITAAEARRIIDQAGGNRNWADELAGAQK